MSHPDPKPLAGLICDCDGVLVDTEVVANAANATVLGPFLPPGSTALDDSERFTGVSDPDIVAMVAAETGVRFPADIVARMEAAIDAALAEKLAFIPGARAALSTMPGRKAVASNGPLHRIERSVALAGLTDLFDGRLYSADQVPKPKPAPDLYHFAASGLGLTADACLVIEDSPTGVTAAAAAGAMVIGFIGAAHTEPGRTHALHRAGAITVASHWQQIPALAQTLGLRD